jgi:hypothetical protein
VLIAIYNAIHAAYLKENYDPKNGTDRTQEVLDEVIKISDIRDRLQS